MLKSGWTSVVWRAARQKKALLQRFRPISAMPAILHKDPHSFGAGYKDGLTPNVQMPSLPKEMEGKFVRGQMYKYQESLPKLPVPPLQQTLSKYLKGVQTLVSSEEFERTKKMVAEFGKSGGVGEQLQKKLLERAEMEESWLIDWWNKVAYLGFREPVVINSNPAVGFPQQAHGDRETFAKMVARFMIAMTKYNMLIQNHALPPDMYRKHPMCMVQYDVYSRCRIPMEGVDIARMTPFKDSRHLVVIRNGHFFKLDIVYQCPDGTLALAPPKHIIQELLAIMQAAPDACDYPVGVLTTEHRDNWFKTRQELLQDPVNRSTLDTIETAQAVFSLDHLHSTEEYSDRRGIKYWDEHKTMLANRYLHGNGSSQYSCNRWFDAAILVLCGEDGGVGSNLEHSAADGVCAITVDLFALDLQEMCDVLEESSPVPKYSLNSFQPLHWNISPRVARDIDVAKQNIDKFSKDVDLNVFVFTDFGKSFPKSMKVSPDGFIQNAILLTYYRMYGKVTAMYESGGTRMFRLGRTDTIRNTTPQAQAFIDAMESSTATNFEKAETLVAAVKAHSQATVEAIEGQAFDRHLLGLRMIAVENGIDMPELFKDPTYAKSLHFGLSTSQVPVPNYEMFLCFGAVVPDGYGVCYNPQENQVMFSVSCFRSCPDTDSIRFLKELSQTMIDMRDAVVGARGVSSKL